MKVIGLTGGTGSGKSVVSKSLAAAGAVVIDADKIAHEIILKGEPAYQEIVKYYGTEFWMQKEISSAEGWGKLFSMMPKSWHF